MSDGIRKAIKALFQKGDVIEIRAWDKRGNKYVGRYPYGTNLVAAIDSLDDGKHDIYVVLNPTKLETVTLRRQMFGTREHDVSHWRRFLLDVDPVTVAKDIASDDELAHAVEVAKQAKAWLESYGYDGIVIAGSGNGVHLLVPCDLPVSPESKQIVRRVQRAVSNRFSDSRCKIECFNDADRLVRMYGTINAKGKEVSLCPLDGTKREFELKHRRSGLIE
jgi:hypothetical protein